MKKTAIRKQRSKPRPGRLKGLDLEILRSACLYRDHGLCQACFVLVDDSYPDWHERKFHMAHIKAKRIGGDSLENVRTLCGACHRAEHNAGGKPCPKKVRDGVYEPE